MIRAKEPFEGDHVATSVPNRTEVAVMHQQLDRYDWRRADRFEPSVLLTTAIGILLAVALANLL